MINYKGGVAKTTSTFNLGAGLSFLNDQKVLLIDLDPQCSLTNICLKSYSRSRSLRKNLDVTQLDIDQTINHVFKQYLNQSIFRKPVQIDLDRVIFKNIYNEQYSFDFIPATMFDYSNSPYPQGLDDLQIEIASTQFGEFTTINHVSLLANFFHEYNLEELYDYILIDCPPANNLTTQNALVVSDYFLIPTVMDALSSNGTIHLVNLIEKTIFGKITDIYNKIGLQSENNYLKYITKGAPKLLGLFETLRKPTVNNDEFISQILNTPELQDQFIENVVVENLIAVSRNTGDGFPLFSKDIKNHSNLERPTVAYGNLVLTVLIRTNCEFDIDDVRKRFSNGM